mmetsp:Transcript_14281/g.26986  ORF Transcript_14281/g.26986 Transcript_14281/m.26986 type:complete len:127 (-) Transcript_14281:561-941(-)
MAETHMSGELGMNYCVADVPFDLEGGDEDARPSDERSEMKNMIGDDDGSLALPDMEIDPRNERFPFSIVWGPLPCLTWCMPCVGHMGIGDSRGRVHDFAGPYTVNTGHFMTGRVVRVEPPSYGKKT